MGTDAAEVSEGNKPILYNQMILNGTLQSYLVETNETANRRLERMIPDSFIHDSFST